MPLYLWVILIIIAIILLIVLVTVVLLPAMALFNKVSDQKYEADEDKLLTGTLTTSIDSLTATGEVVTTFAIEARQTMPARIYSPNKENVTSLAKGSAVLIVETKNGIAYVIPYQKMLE